MIGRSLSPRNEERMFTYTSNLTADVYSGGAATYKKDTLSLLMKFIMKQLSQRVRRIRLRVALAHLVLECLSVLIRHRMI